MDLDSNRDGTRIAHAFTVDVEEWYHPLRFYRSTDAVARARLMVGMDRLLALLDHHGVRATFFWVAEVALAFPRLVRRLADAGHQTGCHGLRHDRMVYDQAPDAFRAETAQALAVLQELAGAPVTAYRAPCFSITRRSLWALQVLAELGVTVDSSIFPVRNWRYGIPSHPRQPHPVQGAPGLWEAPLSVRDVGGAAIPAAGGAYFRIYPYALTAANLRDAERRGQSAVFYIHPWELDPGHPIVPFHWKAWATHYWGLGRTVPRLGRLLGEFRFGTLEAVVAPLRAAHALAGAAA
jgi:polysaccharide deacetylase family protein (PEP-CTERM system associated)